MNKKAVLSLALACAAVCVFPACSDKKGTTDGNTETALETEIKSAFAAKHKISPATVHFSSYGEYNGAHAVMITADGFGAGDAITYDTVGGIILTYPTTHKMDVYYNGEFCPLSKAYETGLLTNPDLIEIAKKYGGQYLTEKQEAEIAASYRAANAVGDDAEVIISSYYGQSGGYLALSVGVKGTAPYLDKVDEITADGELFGNEYHTVDKIMYYNKLGISLYRDGSLCTLKHAVENKLITVAEFHGLCGRNSYYFVS